MRRPARLAAALAVLAAGGAGYWAGHRTARVPFPAASMPLANWSPARPAAPSAPALYYRDPDGRPVYALEPRTTADGRPFRAVAVGEDVGFDVADEGDTMPSDAAAPATRPRTVLYYRNPMGLPDTSATPKKDSMGMDYIPVYQGEDADGAVVSVSPAKMQRTGVRTSVVERRLVSRPVRVPGSVTLDERRVTVVATRSEAFIDHVEDVTTGDRVRRGDALVHVYSPEINAAAAQFIANPGYEGARRRLQNLNVAEVIIDEMGRTRKVPKAVTWSAPQDGLVLARNAVEGMRAGAGDTLFRIGDLSLVWVVADVPERDLASVRVGQPVTVRLRSVSERRFAGTVGLIYPQVNPETRAARVRVELPNPDGVLLPDMYADVEIATGTGTPVVAVPDDAVLDTGERQAVLLVRGEGRFEPRPVRVGARGGGYVEIREGLAPGDRVVTAANFLIDAESNLKAALQGMTSLPPGGQQVAAGAVP